MLLYVTCMSKYQCLKETHTYTQVEKYHTTAGFETRAFVLYKIMLLITEPTKGNEQIFARVSTVEAILQLLGDTAKKEWNSLKSKKEIHGPGALSYIYCMYISIEVPEVRFILRKTGFQIEPVSLNIISSTGCDFWLCIANYHHPAISCGTEAFFLMAV